MFISERDLEISLVQLEMRAHDVTLPSISSAIMSSKNFGNFFLKRIGR